MIRRGIEIMMVVRVTMRLTMIAMRVVKPGLAWGWWRVGEGKKAPLCLLLGCNFSSCVQASVQSVYSQSTVTTLR